MHRRTSRRSVAFLFENAETCNVVCATTLALASLCNVKRNIPHLVPQQFKMRSTGVRGYPVLILLIILVLLAFGTSPVLPYSRGWGYYPSGGLGLIAVIVLVILLLNGGLHF